MSKFEQNWLGLGRFCGTELYFLGIYEVTFKPKLQFNKAYSCVAKQDFRPSIVCTSDPKGDKTQGRYCVKPSKQEDLLCSKSLYVGE